MASKKQEPDAKCDIEQVRKKHRDKIRKEQLDQIFQEKRKELIQPVACIDKIEEEKLGEVIPKPQPIKQPERNKPDYGYVKRMNLVPSYTIFNNANQLPSVFTPIFLLPQPQQDIYYQQKGIVIYKKLLGKGSYSHVWQGKLRSTGEKIAAKQVKCLETNELKALRELSSEHIIKIIDILYQPQKIFIILEYCDRNLRQELKARNFQLKFVMKYLQEIILGMDVLQQKNIIHRDLKFQNILVKDGKIKIADFGLAKFLGNQLQVESRRCGTPYTMAPQIYQSHHRGTYTIKSDIWAIGIIFHQMLYKVHPFIREEKFRKNQRVPIKKNFGILDKIIDECLQFSPSYRISWEELKRLFSYYLEDKNKFLNKQLKYPQSERYKQKQQKRLQIKQRRIDYKKAKKGAQREASPHRDRTPQKQRKFQEIKWPQRKKFQQENIIKRDKQRERKKFQNGHLDKQNKKEQPKPIDLQNNQILKKAFKPEQVLNSKPQPVSVGKYTVEIVILVGMCLLMYYFLS